MIAGMIEGRPKTIAVLDIGKTNLKIVLVSEDGRVVEHLSRRNRVVDGPPYPHIPVDEVWDWFLESLAALAGRHAIAAIVPTTYGSAAALVDENGLALPVLDYEADPPPEVKASYTEIAPPFEEVFAPTNPAGLTLARQLHWQQRLWPDCFARARHLLTYPQYWTWRMTGVAAGEITSLGAQTHLWAPEQSDFSSLAKQQGWDRLVPLVMPAGDVAGTLLPAIADITNLPVDTTVLCGIHDSNANYARYLAAGFDDFTLMSTGTWLISFNAAQPLGRLEPARDTNANIDLAGRPVACARFMIGREYELLAGPASASRPEILAALSRIMENGAMALPAFTESGGPVLGAGGRGRVVGSPPANDAERIALATLYVALMASESLDAIGSRNMIVIDGGFADRPWFAELMAALRPGQPVQVSSETEGTSIGAASLLSRDHGPRWPAPLRPVDPPPFPALTAYAEEWRRAALS